MKADEVFNPFPCEQGPVHGTVLERPRDVLIRPAVLHVPRTRPRVPRLAPR